MGFRISVDTGGTSTDVIVADEEGALHLAKAPTDLARAFQSIENALAQLEPELGVAVDELLGRTDVFTYGTTRATNAIVEGRTARTAFFTTEGFPDILLLREGGKPEPFRQLPYPPPSRKLWNCMAVIVPSRLTPVRTFISTGCLPRWA